MIIRCERCSTLYELDESLLGPEGSPVQCTRCQAIFTARPTSAAVKAAAASPAAPAAGPAPGSGARPTGGAVPASPAAGAAAPATASPGPVPSAGGGAVPAAAPAGSPQAPARPVRTGPAIYKPRAPVNAPTGTPGRPSPPRRDAGAVFEARVRAALRWRQLALPVGVALLLVLVVGGWALWRRRPDPEVIRLAAEASARLDQDDAASLARAVELYDAVLTRSPERPRERANRALARLLQAAAQREDGEPLGDRLATNTAERERLRREQPAGFEDAERTLAMEATRLEADLAPRRRAAEQLEAQAIRELEAVAAGGGGGGALAARGLAVAAVLAGDRERAVQAAAQARAAGPDPWADLAEAWADLRADPSARDRALSQLKALVAAHPELIRARLLLTRGQADAGRREEAVATLTSLLAANPRHERALRLKTLLVAPPVVVAPPPPPPPPAPRPRPVVVAPPAPAAPPGAAPAVGPAGAGAAPAASPGTTVPRLPARTYEPIDSAIQDGG